MNNSQDFKAYLLLKGQQEWLRKERKVIKDKLFDNSCDLDEVSEKLSEFKQFENLPSNKKQSLNDSFILENLRNPVVFDRGGKVDDCPFSNYKKDNEGYGKLSKFQKENFKYFEKELDNCQYIQEEVEGLINYYDGYDISESHSVIVWCNDIASTHPNYNNMSEGEREECKNIMFKFVNYVVKS